jgi:hypothetical protein
VVLPGLCGDLRWSGGAESSLFWRGSVSTSEGAREQRRYEVGQELKTLLVVVGALVGIFGIFIALYGLGAYVIAQVLRYFL